MIKSAGKSIYSYPPKTDGITSYKGEKSKV